MDFKTNSNGIEVIKKYECTFENISSIGGELPCDTSDNLINTTVKEFIYQQVILLMELL